MIHYRTSDGKRDSFDSDKQFRIDFNDSTFTIAITSYGYDEYDFWTNEIRDVVEISIE